MNTRDQWVVSIYNCESFPMSVRSQEPCTPSAKNGTNNKYSAWIQINIQKYHFCTSLPKLKSSFPPPTPAPPPPPAQNWQQPGENVQWQWIWRLSWKRTLLCYHMFYTNISRDLMKPEVSQIQNDTNLYRDNESKYQCSWTKWTEYYILVTLSKYHRFAFVTTAKAYLKENTKVNENRTAAFS